MRERLWFFRNQTGHRIVFGALSIISAIVAIPGFAVTGEILHPGPVSKEIAQLEIPIVRVESLDHQALMAEDVAKTTGHAAAWPMRIAVGIDTSIETTKSGRWYQLDDGSALWRVEIYAPGALNLSLRIENLNLPTGTSMWLHDPSGALVHGPYTQVDRDHRGGLSTPILLGDRLVVEIVAPFGQRHQVRAMISRVHQGFRHFGEQQAPAKQGSCNVDVVCPEGKAWRDQIRSVARYTVQDGINTYLCTGTLMNNTAQDGRSLFLTADHCGIRDNNANTVVVYWNYESPNCGDLSGGSLSQNQTGSTFLAAWNLTTGSDFTLIELSSTPDPAFNVYYAGWDVTGNTPQSAVSIHHPFGDEKAISFEADPLGTIWGTHWQVNDWDQGTTEPGSSGGCLFDESNGLCVGTNSGGYSACGNDEEQWFGQIHKSWTGGGAPSSRLSDHLDPQGLGVTTLHGRNWSEIYSDGFESGDTFAWLGTP